VEKESNELSVRESAVLLGIRLDNAYSLVWAGKLSAKKKNGKWIVNRAAVEQRARARARVREAAAQARNGERTAEGVHA